MKITYRTTNYLIVALLVGLLLLLTGLISLFPESTFQLAKESRLPKWFTLPPNLDRNSVAIEMSYYIWPWGRRAKFTLRDSEERVLERASGNLKCGEPIELKKPPAGVEHGYSSYELITVNGVTETIEHKKMEPIFYITDDDAALKQVSSVGCP